MKFRLVTSLLLIAVLTTLYLWLARTDESPTASAPASATPTTTDPGTTPGLGRIRIF